MTEKTAPGDPRSTEIRVGDYVRKTAGAGWEGLVMTIYPAGNGTIMCTIEIAGGPFKGMEHIYRLAQVERAEPSLWFTAPARVAELEAEIERLSSNTADWRYWETRWRGAEAALSLLRKRFDLEAHLIRQCDFSSEVFGPGRRTAGILEHIRKELMEIEADPTDIKEWVDVIILGFDGAWRAGWSPKDIIAALVDKQAKNEARDWPDWRTTDQNKPIEHIRGNHD